MSELKPCPLCGSSEVVRDGKVPDGWVECNACDCEAPYKAWQMKPRARFGIKVITDLEAQLKIKCGLKSMRSAVKAIHARDLKIAELEKKLEATLNQKEGSSK